MRPAALVAALVVWGSGGCKVKDEEKLEPKEPAPGSAIGDASAAGSATGSAAAQPVPPPSLTLDADAIVQRAFESATSPFEITAITLDYVRADGAFDPKYGKASARFGYHRVAPADDPKRPIGAPVEDKPAEPPPETCPSLDYRDAKLDVTSSYGCPSVVGMSERPTCSITQVWQRAIADGAPANGLAVIELRPPADGRPLQWHFAIDDDPRDIHFQRSYDDAACGSLAVKPVPAEAGGDHVVATARPRAGACDEIACILDDYTGPCCAKFKKAAVGIPARPIPADDVPQHLERGHITTVIAKGRAQVVTCAPAGFTGLVKLRVEVAPDGTPKSVKVLEAADANVGECVAQVARTWRFAATRTGGSFAFPFKF